MYNTPEAQMRKLADFAFMLQDYRFAASTYDVIRKDFQAEKAWRHFASSQEMYAVSLALTEPTRDVEPHFEQAVTAYLTKCGGTGPAAASKGVEMAVRAAFLQYAHHLQRRQFREGSVALIRVTGEVCYFNIFFLHHEIATSLIFFFFFCGGVCVNAASLPMLRMRICEMRCFSSKLRMLFWARTLQ
jgi:hypothetical protein